MTSDFKEQVVRQLCGNFYTTLDKADAKQLYHAVSAAAMERVIPLWNSREMQKRVGYFSAEFLIGRVIESNLLNMGLRDETENLLREQGTEPTVFEEIPDAALGNGGLGRLAACFLDSAATHGIPLDGYGIRYRYGLFRQTFENGSQQERADDWLKYGDPWSIRREEDGVEVAFGKETVRAVPYDMPIIGYGLKSVNTLRLWQAEAEEPFDFTLFNQQKYEKAMQKRLQADTLTAVLYPNDDTEKGKKLRLKQQYFFCSASLQDMFRKYKRQEGNDFTRFHEYYAIQLNDTHPVVSIPECIRLLTEEGLPFDTALEVTRRTFAYTNHTVMPEALETWDVKLFRAVLPQLYRYVLRIQQALVKELQCKGVENTEGYNVIENGRIHMARMALFATRSVNGVAKLHTELLKTTVLPQWYAVYPERFNNKTNGITQRRWLALANRELAGLVTETIGNGWITDLSKLRQLEPYAEDPAFLKRLREIKQEKKKQLAQYVAKRDGIPLQTEWLLDTQVKRLHEYKRQLLNAFSILDIYFGIKDGRIADFTPTVFLFGAKAAPGYGRAKGIIRFINEIAKRINADPAVSDKMQVVFVSNYDVSYAEKIIPATDISQQISTAGTEASGTGNMKFMLNGAVTLGTYDGANIEIVEQAGEANNYIFGARVDDIRRLQKDGYSPKSYLEVEPRLLRVVNTLIDGTFSDGETGDFRELYESLVYGTHWHAPDHYFLFHDFISYCDTRLRANREYQNREEFSVKSLMNIAAAGYFSADRTVLQYAREIWDVFE